MKSLRVLVLGLVLAVWGTPALADCVANGQSYRTGTQIGDYRCQPDGTWQRITRR